MDSIVKKSVDTSEIRSVRTATGSEHEDRYLTLTNQLPIGVYRTKVDGQFVYLNQALAKMLNYDSVDELMKLNVGQLYVSAIDRENQIEVAQNTSEVIQTEFQLWKKGGELIWVRDNSRLLFDKNGSPEYFDGILEDITERKQAEEALKAQEKVYRTLFEGANDAILILKDGLFMNCNRMAVKLFGYNSKKELLGHSPWEFSPETQARGKDSKEKATSLIEKTVSGTPQRFYWRHIRKGGEEFDAEVSLSRMDMDDNVYIQAILRDVTERKRSEQKLMSSEANLKAIIENSLESIWSVNTAYEIQYVNEVFGSAFRETFGVQLRKGVNIISSLPESMRLLWKDRYDRVFNNEHFIFEDQIDMGDLCIYVEVSGNPIVVDSKVVGASFYGKDVTGKKLAENELKKQAALRQILVEISSAYINLPLDQVEPEIYRSMGVIGNYIGSGSVLLFSYNFTEEVIINTHRWYREGLAASREIPEQIPLQSIRILSDRHRMGSPVTICDASGWPDDGIKDLLRLLEAECMMAVPMMNQGDCMGFVGFIFASKVENNTAVEQEILNVYAQMLVNIRLRKQTEEELIRAKEKAEESDRLKSAFLANMSHEIRTPMNGILGFLELLKAPDLSDENKASYLDIVSKSGERLLDTINDIIEISKIEAGEMKLLRTGVNIAELMGYFHGFFMQQAAVKGLAYNIQNSVSSIVPVLQTDKVKLESIITNLLKNAIKFTKSGSIDFGNYISTDGRYLVFYVRDTGIGIESERIQAIFERFVQADLSNTRPHEGSGLGLSIVKAYVGMLGGKIWVESEIGNGSIFSFSLPLHDQENFSQDDTGQTDHTTPIN